jgi:hypothetical protein
MLKNRKDIKKRKLKRLHLLVFGKIQELDKNESEKSEDAIVSMIIHRKT